MSDVTPNGTGAATIREVYKLVNEVREDLGGRIDKLTETVGTVVAQQEHRITIVEQEFMQQDNRITAIVNRIDGHGHDIGLIKDQLAADAAANQAIRTAREKTATTRQWLVGLCVLLVASGIGSVIGIVIH